MRRAALALLLLLGLGITPVLAADKAAPTVGISSPSPGYTFATDEVEVTATFSAAAGRAIAQVDLLVDGTVVQTATLDPAEESGRLTLLWEASGYLDGKHQVVMRVTDTKGGTAKAGIATTLKRGLELPSPVKINSPARNTTVSGTVDFRVETDANVKYVIFLVDNVFKAMSNIRPFSFNWNTTNYLNGRHKLQARAYLSDGTDALSRALTVTVDNPGGATTLKSETPLPTPAVTAAPAPRPAAPVRTAEPVLPPAQHSASPTPYSAPAAVDRGEIGTPGTAPYRSEKGELVTPPTTVLAERTAAGSDLKVATVAEASPAPSAPASAAGASVSAPPAPRPTRIAAGSSPAASPASTEAAATATAPKVAPVQVAALPTPVSVPSRTEAAKALPAPRAAEATPAAAPLAPASAKVTAASAPKPTPPTTTAAASSTKPITVKTTTAPAPAPVKTGAAQSVTPAAPKLAPAPQPVVVAPKPVVVAPKPVVVAPKPVVAAPKPAPTQVALLPTQPQAAPVAPALTPEPKFAPVTSIVINGETMDATFPFTTVADGKGNACLLLPLRAVIEQLGGVVLWSHEKKQVTADAKGNRIVVTLQEIDARVNGKIVHMTVAPVLVEGRTLVHARFLAQSLDLALDYRDGVVELASK